MTVHGGDGGGKAFFFPLEVSKMSERPFKAVSQLILLLILRVLKLKMTCHGSHLLPDLSCVSLLFSLVHYENIIYYYHPHFLEEMTLRNHEY